jgi:hypothetical protein
LILEWLDIKLLVILMLVIADDSWIDEGPDKGSLDNLVTNVCDELSFEDRINVLSDNITNILYLDKLLELYSWL